MAAELWRTDGDYMFYVPYECKQAIQGIERYRSNWKVAGIYQKSGKDIAIQYRVPSNEYAKARRIERRINFAKDFHIDIHAQ